MSAAEDLRAKTDDQLSADLVELKREQFNLRFQAATNQIERPARIREVRREIARIKTLQGERSRAAAKYRTVMVSGTAPYLVRGRSTVRARKRPPPSSGAKSMKILSTGGS